jgi:hypothetical protein
VLGKLGKWLEGNLTYSIIMSLFRVVGRIQTTGFGRFVARANQIEEAYRKADIDPPRLPKRQER